MQQGLGGFSRMLLAVQQSLHAAPGTVVGRDAGTTGPTAPQQKAPSLTALLSNLNPSSKGADTLLTGSAALVQAEPLVSADRLVPGETFQVAVRLKVAEGWHINANPASFEFLIPTTLKVESDLSVEVLAVEYPPSRELKSALAEESLAVYAGEVLVRAKLRLETGPAPGSKGQLRLQLRYQACDDHQCLAPAQVTLPVEVGVARAGEHASLLHREVFGTD